MGASVPKFVVEVAGQPIFAHQLQALKSLDAQIYVVCGYRASILFQLVMADLGEHEEMRKNLTFVYNDDFRLSQVVSIRRVLDTIPLSRRTLFIDVNACIHRPIYPLIQPSV